MNRFLIISIGILITINFLIPNREEYYNSNVNLSKAIGAEFSAHCLHGVPSVSLSHTMYNFINLGREYQEYADNTIPRNTALLSEIDDRKGPLFDLASGPAIYILFNEMTGSLVEFCKSHSPLHSISDSIQKNRSIILSKSTIPNRIQEFTYFQNVAQEAYITQLSYNLFEDFIYNCKKDTFAILTKSINSNESKLQVFLSNKFFLYSDSLIINKHRLLLESNPITIPKKWINSKDNVIRIIGRYNAMNDDFGFDYQSPLLIYR